MQSLNHFMARVIKRGRGRGSSSLQGPGAAEGIGGAQARIPGDWWSRGEGILITALLFAMCFLSFAPSGLKNSQASCKDHLFARVFRDECSREEEVA